MAKPANPDADDYERKKARERERARLIATDGRSIGEIPPPVNPERRDASEFDFIAFCNHYLPDFFPLAWSADQKIVAGMLQEAAIKGGRFAVAMPRGSGKTTLTIAACIWSLLYGHQKFVGAFGPTEEHAEKLLLIIRKTLEMNDRLYDDFPEVCHPIRCLEGIALRCAGQLYNGERTAISWGRSEMVLPTIPDSVSSGSVVVAKGIDSGLRGMLRSSQDGSLMRPSFVIFDDPQTDAVAKSRAQTQTLLGVFHGAVSGLGGPGKSMGIVIPCTVIKRGDFSDQILDRSKNPEFRGMRFKMVNCWPTAINKWSEYCAMRRESLSKLGDGSEATEYYRQHRTEMDAGADVSWPERFDPNCEISALQHAYNLRMRDEPAFFSEYQNEPLAHSTETETYTAVDLMSRTNGVPRGHVPHWATHLVSFIDVQGKLLFWMVCAFDDRFRGAVVDYGAWPDQKQHYFTLAAATRTIQSEHEGMSEEAALTRALTACTTKLAGREWPRDGGGSHRIGRLAIDANWGPFTEVVYSFIRSSPHAATLLPSMGRYYGATSRLMSETAKKPGELTGLNWRISASEKRGVRTLGFDTNWWKSFASSRLATPVGDLSSMTFFGESSVEHAMIADHFTAETSVAVTAKGKTVNEWKLKPERPDNHFWDCLVGCCVLASVLGAGMTEVASGERKRLPPHLRPSLAQLAKRGG